MTDGRHKLPITGHTHGMTVIQYGIPMNRDQTVIERDFTVCFIQCPCSPSEILSMETEMPCAAIDGKGTLECGIQACTGKRLPVIEEFQCPGFHAQPCFCFLYAELGYRKTPAEDGLCGIVQKMTIGFILKTQQPVGEYGDPVAVTGNYGCGVRSGCNCPEL